jgi:hypothetical protein
MFKTHRFAVLLAGVTLAVAAWAQPASEGEQGDPPSRVARLSYLHGDVSFVPAGENDWVEAQLNRPLVTGDKLFADGGARAALEIGAASVRMDQNSNFDFLNLDDNNAQMELTQGSLNMRVRRLYDGQNYEIDTPTLAFVVSRVGEFRVDVAGNGQGTTVTVISGGGDVYGEGGARFRVEEGQSVTFNDSQLQDYAMNDLPAPDAFDDFCHQRDRRMNASTSRRYVSEEVIGYEDLDEYGSWDDAPEYGHVWYPTSIAVGWSPYHYGHWGWVGAYGWSWIDDSPWGFAPFHYGRWVYVGNRWGWSPGRIDVRPVYAPALVAFVGGRVGGVNISIGVGEPIGWFPLGWGEPYIPSYHVSRNYFTNVNVSNTVINNTVINNYYGNYSAGNVNYNQITYANRNVSGAVTAVPVSAFVAAKPVAASAVAVNRETFANSRVNGFAAVAPTRASLAPAVAARAVPTAAVVNRPIVAATKPPAPVAPFAARQTALANNPGKPLPQQQLHATAAVAGATATTGQPKMKLVTQGAPVRTEAPKLPVKTTGAAANATTLRANQSNTNAATVNHSAAAAQATNQTTTTGGAKNTNTQQLNSARFAHPATSAQTTSTTGNTSNATGNQAKTMSEPTHVMRHDATSNGQGANATTINKPQYNQAAPHTEVQEYRKPTGQSQQQYHTQEYHKPAATQTQDTHVQQQQTQQYHAPVQSQQQVHVQQQQAQQVHVQPAAQPQPRNNPPPPPPPQHQDKKNNKDDDKKNGGH